MFYPPFGCVKPSVHACMRACLPGRDRLALDCDAGFRTKLTMNLGNHLKKTFEKRSQGKALLQDFFM